MKDIDDTVNSMRRLVTTGGIIAAVVLVGAVVLFAVSILFQISQFSPFGLWGVLAVIGVATLVGLIVWLRGPGLVGGRQKSERQVKARVVLHAPPPAPLRPARDQLLTAGAGRLGAQTAVNALIAQRRYGDALARLSTLEADDPAMAAFCAAKRRAIARRQAREQAR